MRWEPWGKTESDLISDRQNEKQAQEAAKQATEKVEWDSLPDHRKAARIEYRYFQQMARKWPDYNGMNPAQAYQNNATNLSQFSINPYCQRQEEYTPSIFD